MEFSLRHYLFSLTVFVLFLTTLAHADFQAGQEAYKRGDYETASKEWLPIAKAGNREAQFQLGGLYADGQGVPQNDAQAAKWFRKAAEQKMPRAQYNLGVMYANGRGVLQDDVQAHMWLNLSAAQGWNDAVEARGLITEKMTPKQLAEAQRLAREWLAQHQK
jgi:TPR repeat protein